MEQYNELWNIINFDNNQIFGINWNENDSKKMLIHLLDMGLLATEINNKFISISSAKENISFGGSFHILNDGLQCAIFLQKESSDFLKFLENKYGQSNGLRSHMKNEYLYDWLVGDIIVSLEINKTSGHAALGFQKDSLFAKLQRKEINIEEFSKLYNN